MKRKNIQHIKIKTQNGIHDISDLNLKSFVAGFPPFLRGIESIVNQPIHTFKNENISSKNILINHSPKNSLPEIELSNTFSSGLKYVKEEIKKKKNIDDFAPLLLFSWNIGQHHIEEIAKMRAARILWAKLMQQFAPKEPKSSALRIYYDIQNEETQKTLKSLTAILGGIQILNTEKVEILTYLQEETFIYKTIDSLAGSYQLEKLTFEIAEKTWELLQ